LVSFAFCDRRTCWIRGSLLSSALHARSEAQGPDRFNESISWRIARMADDLRTRPAIVGGLIAGVLSVFQLTQTCCCLWALFGGAIAARMLISRSPMRVTSNEGARVGMLAGVLAGIIYFFIGLPLSLATIGWRLRVLEELSNNFNNPKLQEILQ